MVTGVKAWAKSGEGQIDVADPVRRAVNSLSPFPPFIQWTLSYTHTHTGLPPFMHACIYVRSTAWSYEKLAEECYQLAEEHSVALRLPPLFFPKISDLVLWVRTGLACGRGRVFLTLSDRVICCYARPAQRCITSHHTTIITQRRANMIHTIRRYGGYEAVVQSLGFIPFSQWNYFCRFYLLMKVRRPYRAIDRSVDGRTDGRTTSRAHPDRPIDQ